MKMSQDTRYNDWFTEWQAKQNQAPVENMSREIAPSIPAASNGYDPLDKPMLNKSLESAPSAAPPAGGGAPSMPDPAMMTANPWAVGASAAMDAYQQYENRKQAERQAEYQAKLDKIRAMQNSLSNAAQMAGRISYT